MNEIKADELVQRIKAKTREINDNSRYTTSLLKRLMSGKSSEVFCFDMIMTEQKASYYIDYISDLCVLSGCKISSIETEGLPWYQCRINFEKIEQP